MSSEKELTAEEKAEKQKILDEYRQGLYQITTSGLPDPLIMELLLSQDDSKLLSRHKITQETANQLRSDIGLKSRFTPKLARIVINLMYGYNTNGLLVKISNQLAESLRLESQNFMMMQKLTTDINILKNNLEKKPKKPGRPKKATKKKE